MNSKSLYHKFLEKNELPIFFQDWWLNATAGKDNWDVLITFNNNDEINAVWPIYFTKRFGFKVISNPILSPYLGIWFNYPIEISNARKIDFEEREIKKMIKLLPNFSYLQCGFHEKFTNWQPFYWADFDQTSYYTYIIEPNKSIDLLYNNLNPNIRNHIKNAGINYIIEENFDIEPFFELIQITFEYQNILSTIKFKNLKNIFEALTEHKQYKLLVAKNLNNQIICGCLFIYDKFSVYNILSGCNRNINIAGAMQKILWEGICFANNNNLSFNFEGSMIKKVNELYSSYGANQIQYFLIRKSKTKWIEIARTLLRKNL